MVGKYAITIYWSNTEQAIISEVPELAGCAADGTTYQEALANVETVEAHSPAFVQARAS